MNQLAPVYQLLKSINGFVRFITEPEFAVLRRLCEDELRHEACSGNITHEVVTMYVFVITVLLRHMMVIIDNMEEPNSKATIGETTQYVVFYRPQAYMQPNKVPALVNCGDVLKQCLRMLYLLNYPSLVQDIHNKLVMHLQGHAAQPFICHEMQVFTEGIGSLFAEPPLEIPPEAMFVTSGLQTPPNVTPQFRLFYRNVTRVFSCCYCNLLPLFYNDGVESSLVCCKPEGIRCNFIIKLE